VLADNDREKRQIKEGGVMGVMLSLLTSVIFILLSIVSIRHLSADLSEHAPAEERKVEGVFALFGYFSLLGACLLTLVTLWRAGQLLLIEVTWPAVEAEVVHCTKVEGTGAINTYGWDHRRKEWTEDLYGAECLFRFEVAEQTYEVATRSCCTHSRDEIASWQEQYRSGSKHQIRYDPYDRQRISLAGADRAIASATPQDGARDALVFAVVGYMCFFIARKILFRRQQAMKQEAP
jgi:hypothetical protein